MNRQRNTSKALRAKTSIAILITAAGFMLLVSGLQQVYSRKQIYKGLEQNAEMELVIKSLNIQNAMASVELAVHNHVWEAEQLLPYPDSLFALTYRIVVQNPNIDGCCIAMIPGYYPEKGSYFEPYTLRRNANVETSQFGSEEHDYTQNQEFIYTIENDTCYWSEPYPDPDNPDVTLVTFSYPIHDKQGKVVAAIGVDLNADWLGDVINSKQIFPSSYNLLISRGGKLICGPRSQIAKRQEVNMMVEMLNDSTLERSMSVSGKSRLLNFIDQEDGSKGYVYYMAPNYLNHWQIAVVNYDDEVYAPLRDLRWRNLLLTLVFLLVFAFIIHRSANNLQALQQANLEKEHIESELNIARKIQMDMLPKSESETQRDDVGICGSLVPAKMVGGDLYDYFIRDEKLYFCIGDVSGKGVPAALVMAVVHTLFRSVSVHESRPDRIMRTLNETACQGNESNMFVTFFIGVLDLPTGRLRYCNAGHDCPFVIGNETIVLPAKAHLPLGVVEDMVYVAQETELASGDTLFLFTDGLTEAKNAEHQLFGMPRLTSFMQSVRTDIGPKAIINKVTAQVDQFVQEAEQSDDLTLLAVQYTPTVKELVFDKILTISNKTSEITRLNTFVKSSAEAIGIEAALANKIKLAVEEAVINIIDYAFANGAQGTIDIAIEADESAIRFVITDSGAEFDPTSVTKADTTLGIDERPIGGLGIFLVRNLMDSINYERIDGKNVLRLEKIYDS